MADEADPDAVADGRAVFSSRARPAGMGRSDRAATREGERIVIEGRVLDGDGAPVPDAVVEIWQANAAGRYAHPEDKQNDKPLDPNFRGFGRVADRCRGRVSDSTTVKPGPVPGRGNACRRRISTCGVRARPPDPSAHADLFRRRAANAADPLLSSIEDPAVRGTLLARREAGNDQGGGPARYRFDIIMQGDNETAFLEL